MEISRLGKIKTQLINEQSIQLAQAKAKAIGRRVAQERVKEVEEGLKVAHQSHLSRREADFHSRVKREKERRLKVEQSIESGAAGFVGGKAIKPLPIPVKHLPDLDLRR